MCIEYRLLNNQTVPDLYMTPCIEDALNALTGSQWFSVLDLSSGYYQIAMSKRTKGKLHSSACKGFIGLNVYHRAVLELQQPFKGKWRRQ